MRFPNLVKVGEFGGIRFSHLAYVGSKMIYHLVNVLISDFTVCECGDISISHLLNEEDIP